MPQDETQKWIAKGHAERIEKEIATALRGAIVVDYKLSSEWPNESHYIVLWRDADYGRFGTHHVVLSHLETGQQAMTIDGSYFHRQFENYLDRAVESFNKR